jgi:hypothetical protein
MSDKEIKNASVKNKTQRSRSITSYNLEETLNEKLDHTQENVVLA